MSKWLKAKVVHGAKDGRKTGYPTLNLDKPQLMGSKRRGVYASQVRIHTRIYTGALYYGPRIIVNESKDVLEIYLLGYDGNAYGQTIEFQVVSYIRPVMDFSHWEDMATQMHRDIEAVKFAMAKLPHSRTV